VAELTDEQRRALQLLARYLDRCAEAVFLELGFSYDQLGELVFNGFATMHRVCRRWPQEQGRVGEDHQGGMEGDH
jgi:hypothetical protein